MSVTLRQVAVEAGVSAATVSRALRRDPRLTEETILRVTEAARRLKYVPNYTALNLSRGRTNCIWLLMFSWENSLEHQLARCLQQELERFGYELLILYLSADHCTPDTLIRHFGAGLMDGVLVIPPDGLADEVSETLCQLTVPVLYLDRWGNSSSQVITSDNFSAAGELVELCGEGNMHWLVAFTDSNAVEQERYAGAIDAIGRLSGSVARGVEEFVAYGKAHPERLLGAVSSGDERMLLALRRAGWTPEMDQRLYCGFFDQVNPLISGGFFRCVVCRQNFQGIAEHAVKTLLQLLSGKIPETPRIDRICREWIGEV